MLHEHIVIQRRDHVFIIYQNNTYFQEAECQKSAMDVKYSTDTKIEDNSRMFKLQKANFDQEINTAVSITQYIVIFH